MSNQHLVVIRNLNATPLAPLSGTENDALHLQRFCLANKIVSKSDIYWLKDKQAKRQAFLNLMLDVVIPRTYDTEGGTLLSLFSGHGARDRAVQDGNEKDGFTEFQVPYDYRENGYWSDTELAALYGMINPSWRVRLWNDCCHSGDSIRSFTGFLGMRTRKALAPFLCTSKSFEQTRAFQAQPRTELTKNKLYTWRGQLFVAKTLRQRGIVARTIWELYQQDHFKLIYEHDDLIAAQGCHADQYSMDAKINGIPQGAFSAAIWASVAQLSAQATWSEIHQAATRWLKSNGFTEQDPLLEASAPHLLNQPFFS